MPRPAKKDTSSSIECVVDAELIDKGSLETADAILAAVRMQKSKKHNKSAKPLKKKKIVIIEDNTAVCKALQTLFGSNHEIVVKGSPVQCIQEAPSFVPDLILAKYDLPGMNAHQMANVLKENPLLKHVPVIIYDAIGEISSLNKGSGTPACRFSLNEEGRNLLKNVYEILEA